MAADFTPVIVTGLVSPSGRLSSEKRERLRLGMLALAGQRATVTLTEERPLRSRGQNNGYWGYIIEPFAEFLGYTPKECHEACKRELLGLEPAEAGRLARVRSTAGLTDRRFARYVQDILILAAKQGCVINPGDGPWR